MTDSRRHGGERHGPSVPQDVSRRRPRPPAHATKPLCPGEIGEDDGPGCSGARSPSVTRSRSIQPRGLFAEYARFYTAIRTLPRDADPARPSTATTHSLRRPRYNVNAPDADAGGCAQRIHGAAASRLRCGEGCRTSRSRCLKFGCARTSPTGLRRARLLREELQRKLGDALALIKQPKVLLTAAGRRKRARRYCDRW